MGFFGQDCENQCHCKQGTCNHVTGLDCDECVDGYTGETCTDKQTTTTEKSPIRTTIMSSSTTTPRTTSTMKATNTETVELSTESKSTSPIPSGDSQTQGRHKQDNTSELICAHLCTVVGSTRPISRFISYIGNSKSSSCS